MMKQSGIFKKLFFGFAIFFAALTQGWGGGASSGSSTTPNPTKQGDSVTTIKGNVAVSATKLDVPNGVSPITQCGLFPDAISSMESILLNNATNTITNSGPSMTAPTLTNQSSSKCDGTLCTANGDKPYSIELPQFYDYGIKSEIFLPALISFVNEQIGDIILNSERAELADYAFVNEQIGDIILNGSPPAEGIKVSFSAPYSPSYGAKVMYIKGIKNNLKAPVELNFTEGDYWIDDFDLNGDSTTIKTTGKVRLFVNKHMFINGSQFTLSSDKNTYIFAYQGFKAQARESMRFENTYIYSKEEITFKKASTQGVVFSGAITSEEKVTIDMDKESTFTYRSTDLSIDGYGSCDTTANYPFDAWETTGNVSVKNIYTKLYDTSFDLTIASLNDARTELVARDTAVSVSIVDADNKDIAYSDTQTIYFINDKTKSATFKATKAARNARIKIINKDPLATACTSAAPCYSTDTFTIRPQYLSISGAVPFIQKAGDNANKITINTGAAGYNQSLANLTLAIAQWKDVDGNGISKPASPYITTGLTLSGSDFDSSTGNTTDAVFIFSDVGRFMVDVNDTDWAKSSNDIKNGDCLTSSTDYSSANTLTGGKYGCYVMLKPQNGIDLRFTPYQFNITDASLANTQNSFTYFSSDLSLQAATIPMTITAVNKDGGKTVNYSSSLYARAISLSVTGLTKDNYKLTKNDITSSVIDFVEGKATLNSASSNVPKFNYERSDSVYLSTTMVKGSDVGLVITDSDNVSGTATSIGGEAKFLYGRMHMPNSIANAGDTVRVFAEVYGTTQPCTGCVQAPGSTNWWINTLDSSSAVKNAIARPSTKLDTTASLFTLGTPTVKDGIGAFAIPANATDQKIVFHLGIPSYLWYGTSSYSYSTNSDCTQHPCGTVEIFGVADKAWYGTGDKKGDKAIQTVPKGKRAPKMNW